LPQYYNITHLFCFLLLYYPRWAIQRRPCYTLTETVISRNVQQSKTHQQPPFSMAIISTLSSKTTLPISYYLKRNVWGRSISSGHNYVCLYFVLYHSIEPECTPMMCFMFKCRPYSILYKPSYYSALRPRDFWSTCIPMSRNLDFFPMLSNNTPTICAYPPFQYSASSTQLGLGVNPNPAGSRYFGLGVNPNPADFLDRGILVSEWTPNPTDFLERGILVSEWTQIPQIFSTAVFWSRSAEPESGGFFSPRYFGLGVNPNPADFLNRHLRDASKIL